MFYELETLTYTCEIYSLQICVVIQSAHQVQYTGMHTRTTHSLIIGVTEASCLHIKLFNHEFSNQKTSCSS